MDLTIGEPQNKTDWQQYYALRWQILRAPWRQPPGSEKDAQEDQATHCMARCGSELCGVGRLHLNANTEAQIRYMAVVAEFRLQGIGEAILSHLESKAAEVGAKRVVLDARDAVVGFYRKQGYRTIGPGHTLFGEITHQKMEKLLENS